MQFSKNVIHLINAKTTGGIEIGAKQAEKLLKKKINYKVKFLYNHSDNLFSKFKKIFYEVFKIKRKIDKGKGNEIILISSLWASHLLCFFLKLLNNSYSLTFGSYYFFQISNHNAFLIFLKLNIAY